MRRLYADHWNCWLGEDSRLAAYQESYKLIIQACERYEREPDPLTKSVGLGVCLEGTAPNPGEVVLTGPTSEIANQLGQFLDADLDQVMIQLFKYTTGP